MLELANIEQFLRENGILLSGPIVYDHDQEPSFYVFVKISLLENGKQKPTSYQLNRLRKKAADRGWLVHFILVSGEKEHIDRSLKTMLFGQFPDDIRNSFAAVTNKSVNVWIEPKHVLSEDEELNIRKAVYEFISILSLDLSSFKITQSEDVPTPTTILRVLRIHSPATTADLDAALGQEAFSVPNDIWLNHTLDKLRKAGLVLRKANGEYMLTLHGLTLLGSRKDRRSPDIARALALSRKKA